MREHALLGQDGALACVSDIAVERWSGSSIKHSQAADFANRNNAPLRRGREVNMATGLYVRQDGSVIVGYGLRHISISSAQYKANGYKPAFEKLATNSSRTDKPPVLRPKTSQGSQRTH